MDTDSESDHDIPTYDSNNVEADNFRKALSKWKQTQLENIIGEDQDTLALNSYLKRTSEQYEDMKNYIEENKKSDRLDKELLAMVGNPQEFSTDTRINILHTLFRDLIEFPFTYDTVLINSFNEDEAVKRNIVGNK